MGNQKKVFLYFSLLLATAAYILLFTVSRFKKVGFAFKSSEFIQSEKQLKVTFDANDIFKADQKFTLKLLDCFSQQEQTLRIEVNGRQIGVMNLASGKKNYSGIISGILPDYRNELALIPEHNSLSVARIEIKNVYGFSSGILEFYIVDKASSFKPWLTRKWPDRIFCFLVIALALLFFFRKNKEVIAWSRKPAKLIQNVSIFCFCFIVLLIMVPPISFLWPGKFQTFLSLQTFSLLALAALAALAISNRIGRQPYSKELTNKQKSISPLTERQAWKREYVLSVLLLPTLLFAFFVLKNFAFFQSPQHEFSDLASYSLQIERAKHFLEYLGPYSRFEFHHPGPISFYYYALMEKVLFFIPTPMGRYQLAQVLLNYLFLLMALHLIFHVLPEKRNPLLFFFCLLFTLRIPPFGFDALAHTWPPFLLLFPMLLFVLAIASLSYGDLRFIFPATLSFVFIVQNNLSGMIIAGPFVVMALAAFFWNKKKHSLVVSKKDVKYLWTSALFLLITFLPPLFEQFTAKTGNLTRIARFLISENGIHHSFIDALAFTIDYFVAPLRFSNIENSLLLIGLSLFALLNVRKSRSYFNYLIFYLFSGIGLSIFGATQITAAMHQYILLYEVAFVVILYFACSHSLTDLIRMPALGKKIIFTLLLLSLPLLVQTSFWRKPLRFPKTSRMVKRIVTAIQPSKAVTYELFIKKHSSHHNQWEIATAVGLNLVRSGCRICVPDEWAFLFGANLAREKQSGKIERVAFYTSRMHQGNARIHSFTISGTTIEFGDLLPLPQPIHFDGESADDYFENWSAAGNGFREMSGSEACINIPLGKVAGQSNRRGTLKIWGRPLTDRRIIVKLNDQFLGTIDCSIVPAETTFTFDQRLLKQDAVNQLYFQCPVGRDKRNESPAIFSLNSIDFFL